MTNDRLDDQRVEWLAELAADLRKEKSPYVREQIKRTIYVYEVEVHVPSGEK